jgi:hypothetical protein
VVPASTPQSDEAAAVVAEVEHALAHDGGFNERWSATRQYLAAGLDDHARRSVAVLADAAVGSIEQAIAAHLTARAGDTEGGRRLLAGIDVTGTSTGDDEDAYARCFVTRAMAQLGDGAGAWAVLASLAEDDALTAATGVVEDLAGAGQLARAEAWAVAASRGGDATAWLAIADAWAAWPDADRARVALAQAMRLARQQESRRGAHLARAAVIWVRLGEGAKAATLAREVTAAEPEGGTAEPRHLLVAALAGGDRESVQRLLRAAWSGAFTVEQLRSMLVVARYHLTLVLPLPRDAHGDRQAYAGRLVSYAEAHVGEVTDAYVLVALYADLARARLEMGDPVRAIEHARRIPQVGTRVMVLIEIAAALRGARS